MHSKLVIAAVAAVALAIWVPVSLGDSEAVDTHVHINQHGAVVWKGTVTSRVGACEDDRKVTLRFISGRRLGSDVTNGDGEWKINGGDKPGQYFADTPEKRISVKKPINCAYGSSKLVTVAP